jgi:hypothetical protein
VTATAGAPGSGGEGGHSYGLYDARPEPGLGITITGGSVRAGRPGLGGSGGTVGNEGTAAPTNF